MKGASFSSFLLFVLEMNCYLESQVAGQPKAHVQCSKICTTFSKKIPQNLLNAYKKTEPLCPKAAVIFVTKKFKEFCADPDAGWVKEAIQQLDQRSLDARKSSLSSTVTSVTEQEGAGVFHRPNGGAVPTPTKASVPANPFHGTGTTVSQAMPVSVLMTEEANKSTLPVQEAKRSSTLQATVTPSTISPDSLPNGSAASITIITTTTAEILGNISTTFNSEPTSITKSSESIIESTKTSTGSTMNPTTDIPGTAPSQFNLDPSLFIKGFESTVHPTYKSVGSTRDQTADILGSASSRIHSTPPSTSRGQVPENSTMTATAVLKRSGPTPPSTSAGGESHSVSMDGGEEREAISDSAASAHTTNYLSPLGKKDPPHSFPESISPPKISELSTKSILLQKTAGTASETPDIHLSPAPNVLSPPRTHICSFVLLISILCFCSAAAGMYAKSKACPGGSAKEVPQALLFRQQGCRTDEYAIVPV